MVMVLIVLARMSVAGTERVRYFLWESLMVWFPSVIGRKVRLPILVLLLDCPVWSIVPFIPRSGVPVEASSKVIFQAVL